MNREEGKKVFEDAYKAFIADPDILRLLHLRACTDLGRFSIFNLMWLWAQAMERNVALPQSLATTKRWHKVGRRVTDEHFRVDPWQVIKPVRVKREVIDKETGDKSVIYPLVGFNVLDEYALDQTDGKELPELSYQPPGDDKQEHLENLIAYALDCKLDVVFEDTGEADGYYDKKNKKIAIKQSLPVNARLTTLIHELIHHGGVDYQKHSRQDAEVITETAMAIVCMRLDLDVTREASYYVALWSKHDPAKALKLLGAADAAARRLEKALGVFNHEKEAVAA